jgi:hypothetical protein
MVHANAKLTPRGRLELARCVVEDKWPLARAAERFQVSATTAKRWADRYRQQGATGMIDRSSRPHHNPSRTPRKTEQRIIKLRLTHRLGPARIAGRLGLNPSTVHRVLTRYHCPRLTCLDRGTGRRIRRYEHDRPGDLIHIDVKKLGNIPDGGGWRVTGRGPGKRNRATTPGATRDRHGGAHLGYGYLHTALDDHSRLAYTEILPDERQDTAAAFLARAHAWYAAAGITIERVLSDIQAVFVSGKPRVVRPVV